MTSKLVWIDTDNVSTDLVASSGYEHLVGMIGMDAPPVENNMSPYLSSDGSTLVKARRPERRVGIPLLVNTSGTNVRDLIANLADILRGPGTLRFEQDERTRDLTNVIYEMGMEGDENPTLALADQWRKVVVGLIALDPWWYGESKSVTLSYGADIDFDDSGTDFDESIGFNGSTATPVSVSGHTAVSPVTTIEGPFTTCQVGLAGGQTFALADALADGDTITVDSRPASRGPSLNGGPIDWSLLTPASRLWELPTGSSTLNTAVTGDGGASNIEVEYRERWLTP